MPCYLSRSSGHLVFIYPFTKLPTYSILLASCIPDFPFTIERGKFARVGGEGDQREVVAVQVIGEIKDPRETCSGVFLLVPGAICPLGPKQVENAALHGLAAGIACGQQSHNGPGRL